jgi:glycosyltransferase 2 family protein
VKADPAGRWAGLARVVRPAAQTLQTPLRTPGVRLAAQAALIALCLYPVLRQAPQDWGSISLLAHQLKTPALMASLLALILGSLFLPTAMAAFTRGASSRIGYRHSALAYYSSQPMKYLPGSFWILPGRVFLLRGLGHDVSLSSAALFFEMITQVLSASLVAAVLIGLTGFTSGWYREIVWLVLAGSLAASLLFVLSPSLAQRVLARFPRARQAIAQLAEVPLALRLRNLVLATLLYGVMWLLMGASFYGLIVAANPHLDPALLKAAIGVFTLGWLAGFLAPFSPGGIGVREGVLVLLLTPFVGGPQAVIVALLSRVISLAVELAFAAGAWLPLRWARSEG